MQMTHLSTSNTLSLMNRIMQILILFLTLLKKIRILSGIKVNRGKTMLTVFENKENDSLLCDELGIKWCTRFKLLGIWFDQTLADMKINYENAKTKVKAIANSWRNRYV